MMRCDQIKSGTIYKVLSLAKDKECISIEMILKYDGNKSVYCVQLWGEHFLCGREPDKFNRIFEDFISTEYGVDLIVLND